MTTGTDGDEGLLAEQVEARLMSHGVYVTSFESTDDGYRLAYESVAADGGEIPHRELGRVINVFLDLHPDDWAGARIEAVITDLDGERRGSWHVEPDWLDALTDGELSQVDFSSRVIDTLDR